MVYASIIIELVRVRPYSVFWFAALTQALLWFLVPALFYAAPPGDLAETLAVGHELRLGTAHGPPLAYWLAEASFVLAGSSLVGVYLLAQLCVVIALWSLMVLGRGIVGVRQSVLAVLLMVGVSALAVPTPDFGPSVLAMPLSALALLHAWRVYGEERRESWFGLAIAVGLLLLTTYSALVLVGLLALFVVATRRGRQLLATPDPWFAALIVAAVVLPYALWLAQHPQLAYGTLGAWRELEPVRDAVLWVRLLGYLLLVHAGAVLLIALAIGWPFARRERAPVVERHGTQPIGRRFVYFFAVAPPLVGTLVALLYDPAPSLVAAAPFVLLSGLGVIVFAGERIRLHRQRTLAFAWIALLLAPPAIVMLGVTAVPRLLPVEVRVAQPAAALGRFFGETFERRTGKPVAVVAGDRRLASLVALSAASRPRLYIDEQATPWLAPAEIGHRGAVVLWRAEGLSPGPPAEIAAQFPGLIPEVPRTFERPLHGFGPPLRIGWAVIRPSSGPQSHYEEPASAGGQLAHNGSAAFGPR